MLRMSEIKAHGRRAIGRVVRLETLNWQGEQPAYVPVVEFQAENRKVEIKGWGSFPPGYQVGQEVSVHYFPGCPEKGQIISGHEWLLAWIFMAGGMVFILVAILVALVVR
jgi:hypothetical protein